MKTTRRNFLKTGTGLAVAGGFAGLKGETTTTPVAEEIKTRLQRLEPVTREDYLTRREKARRLMQQHDLDALFIEAGTDLVYFSGVHWWPSERVFALVLPRKGEPLWISPAFEEARARELMGAEEAIRVWQEDENPYRVVSGLLHDFGILSGRMALAPGVRHFVLDGLMKQIHGVELVNGAAVTESCRGIKSAKELAHMEVANQATKLAYRQAFRKIRTGMEPDELAGLITKAHAGFGVQGGGWPSFGASAAQPHGSSLAQNLGPGEVVLVDGGCRVAGYRSDVTRTVVHGRPTDRQRRVWDTVKRAQDAVFAAVRPGITCGSLDRVARKVIEDAGFGPGYRYFSHRLGHGIGLDGHEYPYLVRGNDLKLKPGMTFSNEPGIYIPGEFGIRLEDCFAVTETGARILGGMRSVSIDRPFGTD